MGEVLHELHQHRPAAAGDIEEALDPQQVGAAQRHQRLHARARTPATCSGASSVAHEARDAVGVRGLGDEAGVALARVVLVRVSLDQAARIDLARRPP